MHGHTRLTVVAALAITLAAGCAPTIGLRTPAGFVEVEPSGAYAYRATSAAGVVLGVRALPNEPRGDLSFWSAALEARLARLYGEADAAEVRTASGYPGRQLRFSSSVDGRPHRYWATIFVTPSHVFVVEAAGDQAYFDPSTEVVEETLLSFDPS